MYLDDDELELALQTLRGQQLKLWLAIKAKGLTSPDEVVARVFADYGISSDVCARYRNTVFLEDATWQSYYGLFCQVLSELDLEASFWRISKIGVYEPTLKPKTLVRCAMLYAEEHGYLQEREEAEVLEMMLAEERDRLQTP